jgi:hypothetical protein
MSKIAELREKNKGVPSKPVTENMQRKMNGTQPRADNAKTK